MTTTTTTEASLLLALKAIAGLKGPVDGYEPTPAYALALAIAIAQIAVKQVEAAS